MDEEEVRGEVVSPAQLTAPFSGEECVLYRVELPVLQRWLSAGGGREVAGVRFLLRTTGGLVLVDASGARLSLRAQRRLKRLGREGSTDVLLRGLYRRLGREPPARWARGREALVRGGDWLELRGAITSVPHPLGAASGYRQPPRLPLLAATWLRALPRDRAAGPPATHLVLPGESEA